MIRRFVGHERYSRLAAGQTMAHLYSAVRLYVNYFQPSFHQLTKNRNAGSVTKRYSKPATPCDRLLDRDDVSEEIKPRLRKSRSELDPVSLLHSIRESQSALAAVSSPESGAIPDGESLEYFLSQLPDMWRRGEVRPTHARRAGGLAHGGHVPTRSREYGVRYSTGSSSSRTQLLLTCLII